MGRTLTSFLKCPLSTKFDLWLPVFRLLPKKNSSDIVSSLEHAILNINSKNREEEEREKENMQRLREQKQVSPQSSRLSDLSLRLERPSAKRA